MIVILDNGHGGLINGEYQTPGKRSPDWENGVIYEGALNRIIVNRVIESLIRLEIPFYHASPELEDLSLKARVSRINKIHKKNKNVFLLSIHFNAGGGEGIEFFTSKGETKSDELCNNLIGCFKTSMYPFKFRFGYKKEEDFYLLRKTKCPAILAELGFMDNKED